MKTGKNGWLLCIAVCIALLPVASYAQNEGLAKANQMAIVDGTAGMESPVDTNSDLDKVNLQPQDYLYFGTNGDKWRILDAEYSNANTEGMFLLAENGTGWCSGNGEKWEESAIKKWGQENESILFSPVERDAIMSVSKKDESKTVFGETWHENELKNDRLFILSAEEVAQYMANYLKADALKSSTNWWLRSTFDNVDDYGSTSLVRGIFFANGNKGGYYLNNSEGIRTAFNLDKRRVLFSSKADGKPQNIGNNLQEVAPYNGNEWKLTLKDNARSAFTASCMVNTGNRAVLAYSGALSGTNEFISAMVKDQHTGAYVSYGKLKKVARDEEKQGEAVLSLNEDLKGKTLYILNEQDNGGKKTDYASELIAVDIGAPNAYDVNYQGMKGLQTAGKDYHMMGSGAPYTAKLSAEDGYVLPETITIEMDGILLTEGKDYTYNKQDGQISIASVNGAVTITANAVMRTYAVTLTGGDGVFGEKHIGYTDVPAQRSFTLTNTGNSEITGFRMEMTDETGFVWNKAQTITSLKPGDSVVFTVAPKNGLPVARYQAEIMVSGDQIVSSSVLSLSFVVEDRHLPAAEWIQENNRHYQLCQYGCGARLHEAECAGGTSSYFGKAVCTTCRNPYGNLPQDQVPPTAQIAINGKTWDSLHSSIVFETYFRDALNITITGRDDSYDHAGYTDDKAIKLEYYLHTGKDALSESELKAAAFTMYTQPVIVDKNDRYIVYARATDFAGNVKYISSDGIVLYDTIPGVQGIEDGGIYCVEAKFTVDSQKITEVRSGTTLLTPNAGGVYTIFAGQHTIVVTDKAGKQMSMTVTVNASHTPELDDGDCTTKLKCTLCGAVIQAAQIHSFTNYISDQNATCMEDGTETAQCDHTGCVQKETRKDIGSATGHRFENGECVICHELDPDFKVDLPQTGDKSDLMLWMGLLIVSVLGVGVGAYCKHRNQVR